MPTCRCDIQRVCGLVYNERWRIYSRNVLQVFHAHGHYNTGIRATFFSPVFSSHGIGAIQLCQFWDLKITNTWITFHEWRAWGLLFFQDLQDATQTRNTVPAVTFKQRQQAMTQVAIYESQFTSVSIRKKGYLWWDSHTIFKVKRSKVKVEACNNLLHKLSLCPM